MIVPYSRDWIALAMFWDIKMNLIPILTATPIIYINTYTAMVELRCWMTMEVLGSGGASAKG
jgi:hypothetical protein